MRPLLLTFGVLTGLMLLGFVLLVIQFAAGKLRRHRHLQRRLAPLLGPIRAGREPDAADIDRLAGDPETRNATWQLLEDANLSQCFPPQYATQQAFAESTLASWLAHPCELGRVPEDLQLAQIVPVETTAGEFDYYLFRFRTHAPHWAASNGWMAGIAGPFPHGDRTPNIPCCALSQYERFDAHTPREHVERLHEIIARRRLARALNAPPPPCTPALRAID
jgi:hypothetical protein